MRIPFFLHQKKWIFLLLLLAFPLQSCSVNLPDLNFFAPTPQLPPAVSSQILPLGKVVFRAISPAGSPPGDLTLEILDEVTGLAMNPQRYEMTPKGDGKYELELLFPLGSVIKYRFLRGEFPFAVEYNARGEQVRYRIASISEPVEIEDLISSWTDFRYSGATGRIKGQVFNAANNSPFPNALVSAGGYQTLTASDGSFLLEGLPPGTHNLVVYSLDGSFKVFQQGALVAESATTPASIPVIESQFVNVTFILETPETNLRGLPVRMTGNIYSLGNTFADLGGGLSVIAARAPLLSIVADNTYAITLRLPVGLDLRYKYTLGDGFWNAEHNSNGGFVIRQLIIPPNDLTVNDRVESWQSGESAPITFIVQSPANTPVEDTVSIQFNPYAWTSPIPMWSLGNNQWLYVLYSPLNMFSALQYRYCRNDQCGFADDIATSGHQASGYPLQITTESQTIRDEIKAWQWWNTTTNATQIISPEILPRTVQFVTGIETSPHYQPTWQPYLFWGYNAVNLLQANTVIISPTWSYTRTSPPVFESVPGKDPLWIDLTQATQTSRQANLIPWLFPRIQPNAEIWSQPIDDFSWWENWFERYRIFAIHMADLAAQTNAPVLILGGSEVISALPDGKLDDGTSSGVPPFAAERWRQILSEVRQRYTGQVAWALPLDQDGIQPPDWLDMVDSLYVLVSAPLADSANASLDDLSLRAASVLDETLLPIHQTIQKPVFIAVNYPSYNGAAMECLPELCHLWDSQIPSAEVIAGLEMDMQEQVDIYTAWMTVINERDWISGFVSRGYYPPAALQDPSSSIRGKPASDVLWHWFSKVGNSSQPAP